MATSPKAAPKKSVMWDQVASAEKVAIDAARRARMSHPSIPPRPRLHIQPAVSMVNLNNAVIGKSVPDAEKSLAVLGYRMRITMQDNKDVITTMDLSSSRANVEVLNDVVTRVIDVG